MSRLDGEKNRAEQTTKASIDRAADAFFAKNKVAVQTSPLQDLDSLPSTPSQSTLRKLGAGAPGEGGERELEYILHKFVANLNLREREREERRIIVIKRERERERDVRGKEKHVEREREFCKNENDK